jgi:hypothetical protein
MRRKSVAEKAISGGTSGKALPGHSQEAAHGGIDGGGGRQGTRAAVRLVEYRGTEKSWAPPTPRRGDGHGNADGTPNRDRFPCERVASAPPPRGDRGRRRIARSSPDGGRFPARDMNHGMRGNPWRPSGAWGAWNGAGHGKTCIRLWRRAHEGIAVPLPLFFQNHRGRRSMPPSVPSSSVSRSRGGGIHRIRRSGRGGDEPTGKPAAISPSPWKGRTGLLRHPGENRLLRFLGRLGCG